MLVGGQAYETWLSANSSETESRSTLLAARARHDALEALACESRVVTSPACADVGGRTCRAVITRCALADAELRGTEAFACAFAAPMLTSPRQKWREAEGVALRRRDAAREILLGGTREAHDL